MSFWRIGHRGAPGYQPENTLASFRHALELGANAVECDVHRCKSGEPVIIHDATLERTTNGRGPVAAHTLSELKKLDAGNGEAIPTLDELLAVMAPRAVTFIEIKDARAVDAVARCITDYAARFSYDLFPAISFHADYLAALKRIDSRILTGLTSPQKGIPAGFIAQAKAAGMWAIDPAIDTLEEAQVEEARQLGLKIITWTANSQSQIQKAQRLGVDGIISDYPDRL